MIAEQRFEIALHQAVPWQGAGDGEEQLLHQVDAGAPRLQVHRQHGTRLPEADKALGGRVDGSVIQDGEFHRAAACRHVLRQVLALDDREPLSERQPRRVSARPLDGSRMKRIA